MGIVKLSRDVSFGLLALCFVGFLIAFCSSYWYHQQQAFLGYEVHHGLWRMCDRWLDTRFRLPGSDINSAYLKTTQALMCISLGLYVSSLTSYSIWASYSANYLREHGVGKTSLLAVGLFLAAGTFTALSVIVFGVNCPRRTTSQPYGWSFAVAATSSACAIISSLPILIILIVCGSRRTESVRASTVMTPIQTTGSQRTSTKITKSKGQDVIRPGAHSAPPSYAYPTRTQGLPPQNPGYVHVSQYPRTHHGDHRPQQGAPPTYPPQQGAPPTYPPHLPPDGHPPPYGSAQ